MDVWDAAGADFVEQYDRLYGQVRTHVIDRQLREHLPPPPATVVDIGGGAGNQSLPLARDGYDVTIVDPSAAMLERARERLAGESRAVAGRVRLVEGEGTAAPQALGGERFSAVLCHGVLPYQDDPDPLLDALCGLAARDGVVSIMTKNARTLAVRPGLERDWERALAAFDDTREVNKLGLPSRGDTPEELAAALERRGISPVAWYGVRFFTEGWSRDRPATDPVDLVLAVELEASRRDPYRQVSRCFHMVGVRR